LECLKASTGPSPSAHAAAKSAESSAEPTKSPTESTSPSHRAQEKQGEKEPESAPSQKREENKDKNKEGEKPQPADPTSWGLVYFHLSGQLNIGVFGDYLAYCGHGVIEPLSVLALPEKGNGIFIQNLTHQAVWEDPLHTIAGFDAHPSFLYGQEDEYPLVLALLSDPPTLVEFIDVGWNIGVSYGLHRNNDDSGPGLSEDLTCQDFHALLFTSWDQSREIIHGPNGFRKLRPSAQALAEDEKEINKGCPPKDWSFYGHTDHQFLMAS